jgi:hypothetical protein
LKKFEILQELSNVTQRLKMSTWYSKSGSNILAQLGVATNFQCVKKQCLQSPKKRRTKQHTPALRVNLKQSIPIFSERKNLKNLNLYLKEIDF